MKVNIFVPASRSDPIGWMGLVLALLLAVPGVRAASVGPGGYANDFSSQPAAADFATTVLLGIASDISDAAGLNAAVAALTFGSITGQLPLQTGTPPAPFSDASYNDTGKNLQTRPTGVKMTVIMATLLNNSGASANSISLSYTLAQSAIIAEEVNGVRVYYSLTGAAGSWTHVPTWSGTAAGLVNANAALTASWNVSSPLYLLFADDNGSLTPDTDNQIDNFLVFAGVSPELAVSISSQPQNLTVFESQSATFTVGVSGQAPYTFQWYRGAGPIAGATNASYTLGYAQVSDSGAQFSVVAANVASNLSYTATSRVATLTVITPVNGSDVPLQQPTATFSQGGGFTIAHIVGSGAPVYPGWAIAPNIIAQTAAFETVNNLGFSNGTILTFTLSHTHVDPYHNLGRFRLSLTTDSRDTFADGLTSGGDVTANWTVLDPDIFLAANGATLSELPDLSILAGGPNPTNDTYTVQAVTSATGITGFRLEVMEDATLPFSGPGRKAESGNFVLTHFQVNAAPAGAGPTNVSPSITSQPQGVTVYPGVTVAFSVAAQGTPPLAYQWTFNGASLTNATNSALSFTNVQPAQAGGYRVIVANQFGSVTSQVATLTVLPPIGPDVPLQQATATFSQSAFGNFSIANTIGSNAPIFPGWAIYPNIVAQTAAFETVNDLGFYNGTVLTFTISQTQLIGPYQNLGRIRLSLTTDPRSTFADGLVTGGDVTANWIVLDPVLIRSANGTTLTEQPDRSILAGGFNPTNDIYTVQVLTTNTGITGFRLEVLEDPSLPFSGPGRASENGNFCMTRFQVNAAILDPGPTIEFQPPETIVFFLTNLTVIFSEAVSNVNSSDLLVNGVPATGLGSSNSTNYTFSFPQPPNGIINITWATNHGILDFDPAPKQFDDTAPGAKRQYALVNPGAPFLLSQSPAGNTTVTSLTSITLTFSEPVVGLDAADLLINGSPASGLSMVLGTNGTFSFAPPPFGTVTVGWATNHGVQDLEMPANDFEPFRPGHTWNYTFINPVPSVALTTPTNSSYFLVGANITLTATATDNDGAITLVEFFEGTNKLGETVVPPYALVWPNVSFGAYVLRAVATDNSGLIVTSAPVAITVVSNLPAFLVRGPYLQMGTPTSSLVRWRTDLASDAIVRFGTAPDQLTNSVVRASLTNEHILQLGGLKPDTKYYYSIGHAVLTLAGGTTAGGSNYWFTTSPAPGTRKPTRLWVLGDAGTQGAAQASTRDAFHTFAATNGPADLVLMLGDNAYSIGTDAEYQAAVFNMYPTTLRNKFLWPAIGNHDTAFSTTATSFPYLDIFSLPQNGEAGGTASGTEKYYSFDYANIHFVCLDSMSSGLTGNTPMAQWLQNDLTTSTQEWTIVFFHHPPYTKGSHNSDAELDLIQIRRNLVPILEAHGVDLVLSGHSHCYERSYLLDGHTNLSGTLTAAMKVSGGDGREDGDGVYRKNEQGRGVVYNVAGSSGQATGGALNHPAHFFGVSELGSMVIDVNGPRLDAIFLNAAGVTRDYFSLVKSVGTPAMPVNVVVQATGTNQIAVTWSDLATNELGYIILRSDNGKAFSRLATNTANITSFLDSGLLASHNYYYRVISFNGAGESALSGVGSDFTGYHGPALDFLELGPGSAILNAGGVTNVVISYFSGVALTNLSFAVLLPKDRLMNLSVENLVSPQAGVTLNTAPVNGALLNFTALPGQFLLGTQALARLHFTAAAGQSSAFLPLTLTGVTSARAQPGPAPGLSLHGGRVTVIGVQSLLEAGADPLTGLRSLTLYGRTNVNYTLERTGTPETTASWQFWQSITLLNLWQPVDASVDTNAPAIFYRVRE